MTDYLPFDAVVPIRQVGGYYETALNAVGTPSLIGRSLQGRSVRVIPDEDFGTIVRQVWQRPWTQEMLSVWSWTERTCPERRAPWSKLLWRSRSAGSCSC